MRSNIIWTPTTTELCIFQRWFVVFVSWSSWCVIFKIQIIALLVAATVFILLSAKRKIGGCLKYAKHKQRHASQHCITLHTMNSSSIHIDRGYHNWENATCTMQTPNWITFCFVVECLLIWRFVQRNYNRIRELLNLHCRWDAADSLARALSILANFIFRHFQLRSPFFCRYFCCCASLLWMWKFFELWFKLDGIFFSLCRFAAGVRHTKSQ